MKNKIKFLIPVLFVLCQANYTKAQVFDGITQPTTWRFWTPVSLNIETNNVNAAPFIGYKIWINNPETSHFSTTIITQYNFANSSPSLQSWNNVNLLNRRLWFMSRTGYDFDSGKLWEKLSGTLLLPSNFNIDFTWTDFLYFKEGAHFLETDKLQVVGGYKAYRTVNDNKMPLFAVNLGARIRGNTTGAVANLRLYIQKTNWLQFRYDFADKVFLWSSIIQFNK